MKKPKPTPSETVDPDENGPRLAKARLEARAKRAKTARAHDDKMIRKVMEQLGVSEKDLEARADADFDEAKAESARWLKELRANQIARLKTRGALRARIEATYTRFGRMQVTK